MHMKFYAPEVHLPFSINRIVDDMHLAAQEIILPIRNRMLATGDIKIIDNKDVTNPAAAATEADVKAEEFLVERTCHYVPDYIEVFGEEMATCEGAEPALLADINTHPERCRILFDAIDGTISFRLAQEIIDGQSPLRLSGFACVMSYVEYGKVAAAAVVRPLAKERQTYVAIADGGVWVDGKNISPHPQPNTHRPHTTLAVDYVFSAGLQRLEMEDLPFTVEHYYHSNHAAPLAVERPDAVFLMYPHAKPWDMAPAVIFYRAMGGDVVAVGTGEPYQFSNAKPHCFIGVPHRDRAKEVARMLAPYLPTHCVAR